MFIMCLKKQPAGAAANDISRIYSPAKWLKFMKIEDFEQNRVQTGGYRGIPKREYQFDVKIFKFIVIWVPVVKGLVSRSLGCSLERKNDFLHSEPVKINLDMSRLILTHLIC